MPAMSCAARTQIHKYLCLTYINTERLWTIICTKNSCQIVVIIAVDECRQIVVDEFRQILETSLLVRREVLYCRQHSNKLLTIIFCLPPPSIDAHHYLCSPPSISMSPTTIYIFSHGHHTLGANAPNCHYRHAIIWLAENYRGGGSLIWWWGKRWWSARKRYWWW